MLFASNPEFLFQILTILTKFWIQGGGGGLIFVITLLFLKGCVVHIWLLLMESRKEACRFHKDPLVFWRRKYKRVPSPHQIWFLCYEFHTENSPLLYSILPIHLWREMWIAFKTEHLSTYIYKPNSSSQACGPDASCLFLMLFINLLLDSERYQALK